MSALVIGVGNEFRRDDGVGPAVVAEVDRLGLDGVRTVIIRGDTTELLDAWDGVEVTVIVDAAAGPGATPGRIRRWTPGDRHDGAAVSSHALDLPGTYALGQALGRLPRNLVVLTVDAADVGHGVSLTPPLAAAVPDVVATVVAELERHAGRGIRTLDRGPKTPQRRM
mgnify:FL=1